MPLFMDNTILAITQLWACLVAITMAYCKVIYICCLLLMTVDGSKSNVSSSNNFLSFALRILLNENEATVRSLLTNDIGHEVISRIEMKVPFQKFEHYSHIQTFLELEGSGNEYLLTSETFLKWKMSFKFGFNNLRSTYLHNSGLRPLQSWVGKFYIRRPGTKWMATYLWGQWRQQPQTTRTSRDELFICKWN